MLAYLKGWEWGTHWPLGTRQSSHTSLNPTNQPALHPDQPYIFKLLHYVIKGILFALKLSILPVIQMHQHKMHQDTSIASVGSYLRWHPNWIKSYPTFIGWLCIRNMSNICKLNARQAKQTQKLRTLFVGVDLTFLMNHLQTKFLIISSSNRLCSKEIFVISV